MRRLPPQVQRHQRDDFASRKLPIRDYLADIAIFVNGAKGHSALQLSRDLNCQYKSAFVMAHKLREAVADEQRQVGEVAGSVEVDGAYFGGYIKPANRREDQIDRRRRVYQTGKREVVVVMREREGRTLPFVAPTEAAGVAVVAETVAPGSTVYADEASHWDALEARFLTKRINHSEAYSTPEACTNMAESFFSRLRRAEIGHHHHVAGIYLVRYAQESAWREDHRRMANGDQVGRVAGLAMHKVTSPDFVGYWQQHLAA